MQILQPSLNLEAFFEEVCHAGSRVLMLDYDGTLAPFHVDPSEARPWPGIPPLLDAIMANGRTRLVIVSGRWIKTLLPLLHLKVLPEIWGTYGWERAHPDDGYSVVPAGSTAMDALARIGQWAGDLAMLGARCEHKPAALAFHWRGLNNEQIVEIRARLFEHWMTLGAAQELGWHDFDGGIEFRARGWDKGEVVRSILAGCNPGTACAYLGDDLEDEHAFKALQGQGLSVLVRSRLRSTVADLWLEPPDEVCMFLKRWQQAAW